MHMSLQKKREPRHWGIKDMGVRKICDLQPKSSQKRYELGPHLLSICVGFMTLSDLQWWDTGPNFSGISPYISLYHFAKEWGPENLNFLGPLHMIILLYLEKPNSLQLLN